MSKNVNLALLGTLDTTTPEQFLVSTGPDTTPGFQNISLLPSGNTNFIAGSGVTIQQSGNTARYSQLTCPQWHIGQTGKMLARESNANRISQQVSLSANFQRHIQYVTSLNRPVTGAEFVTTPTGTYPGSYSFLGSLLLTDGRVFMFAFSASTSRIYDPINDTVTNIAGTFTGFACGSLLSDGRVYMVPSYVGAPTFALIYNPANDTFVTPSGTFPSFGASAYQGAITMYDGRIFMIPANTSVARIYDPVSDTLTTPSLTFSTAHYGGTLLLDGRVFLCPGNNTIARIYNPFNNTFTTPNGTYPGSTTSHAGCVLMADGRVFCVPNGLGARIYNPFTDTLTTPSPTFGAAHYTGCLLSDRRIFMPPYVSSSTAEIYDPVSDTLTTPSGTYPVTVGSYFSLTQLKDSRVFCTPHYATTARIFNIAKNTDFSFAALTGPCLNKAN